MTVLNLELDPADISTGMNIEQVGSFRTRTTDDGSLEVWARGWRLESQLYALIPMGLSLMFLFAPMSLAMRGAGSLVMLAATLGAFRMTKPGLLFTEEAVSIVSIVRTQRFPWGQVGGFMGERRHDEARIMLILEDERRIPLPGTLDPAELDPYGDEGQLLSAADQLNRLEELARAGDLPKPAVQPARERVQQSDHPSRADRRTERKELKEALKAVRLKPSPKEPSDAQPAETQERPRRSRRLRRTEPEPELTQVTIAEPEPISVSAQAEPEADAEVEPEGLPSYFPTPVYIPQAEYAQMLRDQKAAEKAAAAAAAELSQLADLDELTEKEEFSDWTS